MDLIYRIYSIYLCDNQLNHDYIILYNTHTNYANRRDWTLGYDFSISLNKIYNLDKSSASFNEDSVSLIQHATSNKILVKNEEFLTLVKIRGTHLPNCNIYDVFWNETKSNINIHEYEVAGIWNVGKSSYSTYRIWEEKDEREKVIRDNKLDLVLYDAL